MILLIDSYDSFTNNLAHLLQESAQKEVVTIHNDAYAPEEYEDFYTKYLPLFDYVVIGPGPGHPSIAKDVGIIGWLLRKFRENSTSPVVPVLGICLGFQSLCHEFGNPVTKLTEVKHGQIYDIHPIDCDDGLFSENQKNGTEKGFGSVRYHSLYVHDLNNEIVPLAYCSEPSSTTDGGVKNEILMAVKHRSLPLYGVQYHPESICSSNGDELVKNFTKIAEKYNKEHRQALGQSKLSRSSINGHAVHESFLIEEGKLSYTENLAPVSLKKFKLGNDIRPTDVCDYLYKENSNEADFVLLNSASIPGEWSIIGLPTKGKSDVITHSVDSPDQVIISKYKDRTSEPTIVYNEDVWTIIAKLMKKNYISRDKINDKLGKYHTRDLPFFGGYMGIISYEEGQHVIIQKLEPITNTTTPDLKLVYVERFVVFDHVTNDWFVVSINKDDDTKWVEEFSQSIISIGEESLKIDIETIPMTVKNLSKKGDDELITFELPSRDIYRQQFDLCQDYLHSGDSYELCLTTQSKITLPSYVEAWDIYKVLTLRKNPSPFSCFMQFDDCVLISSSPERFLSWKDKENGGKQVELRPIKGTVRNTPEVDIEAATKILKTPKEMGENLMIVDLIRHDLYQFTQDVHVSQLMAVEEYKTVYQLVSVIQGQLPLSGYHGIDILHRSLPPGSMTGAPKKRSVELLQDIESLQTNGFPGGRRGIYSGVVGYWSVTDDSDWSVIIRSVFHYNEDKENTDETNLWRIGAGGAITVLSEADAEWEEMEVKLTSALQAFT
ncbi:para-aminobenzoate synthase [Scheffersomyces xylosifermentans]|uniref:para-aminobenzoate synthase n=1 Tax=Scheffersomyces xylosifermentans TaxID=1304137 RepID=UPI00315C8056